ncbi:hypothetical protein P4O66_016089 [Electrophorus voltai]|uniref:Uncharacterized protein n=1 Tax=Electrophorus voltai TaxID=2609070 RepID=A0AAD9DM27_9TELE|nr:hypothetical protein P4O66_016089 [Electrophorus voltai]
MHSLLDRKRKAAGAGSDLSPDSFPHVARMFSCVGCFWVLLSSALVAVCSFSFISPAWIVKDQARNKDSVSFGLLWHCSESLDHMYRCYTFGGLGRFAEIPSSSWQVCLWPCEDPGRLQPQLAGAACTLGSPAPVGGSRAGLLDASALLKGVASGIHESI